MIRLNAIAKSPIGEHSIVRQSFLSIVTRKKVAESYIKQLNQKKVFPNPIVTEVSALNAFYPAEEYHQNFIQHNPTYPYVVVHDLPKLEALKKQFPDFYRSNGKGDRHTIKN